LKGEPLTVFGDGNQTRCFAHVDDVVRAILALMDRPETTGEIFNIGNDTEITMGALARKVIALAGSNSSVIHVPYEDVWPDFDEMQRRVPDLRKIRRTIDFRPTREIDEVICSVIDFARANETL
jgi:UDP-glucose 4-epimerase